MKVSERACPDCGSPARGNPCYWQHERPEDWAAYDAPCDRAIAAQRQSGSLLRWACIAIGLIVIALLLIYPLARAGAQEHHERHHASYQNWVNQNDRGCCNNQDCGALKPENERTTATGIEVKVAGEWCPVKPHHYLKRGNAPDWSVAHVCIQNYEATSGKACESPALLPTEAGELVACLPKSDGPN